jgi:hypothetical protein
LLQERSVDGLQPLLHIGPIAIFEFHGAPFWGVLPSSRPRENRGAISHNRWCASAGSWWRSRGPSGGTGIGIFKIAPRAIVQIKCP